MGRSPRWRLDTSVSLVATWASPPPSPHARRVHTKAKGNDSDTEPCEGGSMGASARKRKPPKSTPLSASFSHRDGDFFYGNGDADDVLERSLPDRFATRNDPLRHEVRCLETSHAGSVFGAVALITGSTVGAGVLALPETVSPAGIGPSSVVLFLCWGLLLAEALLLAEVNVFLMRERDEYRLVHGRGHSPVAISLGEMAGRTLGAEGATAVTATYLFLSCTLLTAYVSKGGVIIADVCNGFAGSVAGALPFHTAVDPRVASLAFTVAMGAALAKGGTRAADEMNQALTFTLLSLFALLILGGVTRADWTAADFTGNWDRAPQCVPVIFLALVYHDLIPVICSYLAGDSNAIRKSVVYGSAVPLVMFLIWDAVALGVQAGSGDATGDPLAALMTSGDGLVALVVGGFSFCAIATSFIGTAIGVSEFAQPKVERWAEELRVREDEKRAEDVSTTTPSTTKTSREDEKFTARAVTYLAMLAVPATVAVTNPAVFLPATNFAGAYGMTTMFGILPPVMAWKMRAQIAKRAAVLTEADAPSVLSAGHTEAVRKESPMRETRHGVNVGGGTPALAALSFAACAITLGQLRNDIGGTISSVAADTGFLNPTDALDALASLAPDEVITATAAAKNALFP